MKVCGVCGSDIDEYWHVKPGDPNWNSAVLNGGTGTSPGQIRRSRGTRSYEDRFRLGRNEIIMPELGKWPTLRDALRSLSLMYRPEKWFILDTLTGRRYYGQSRLPL